MKLGGDIALNIFLSVVVLIEDGVFIDLGFILGSSRCPPLGIEDVFGVISGRFFGRVLDFMKGGDLKKKNKYFLYFVSKISRESFSLREN